MAKRYSQDLRDRVIDAVKRGEMSRRAAARRYEISQSVAIKWLERVKRDGSRKAAPGLSGGSAGREIGRHASGPLRSPFGRARGKAGTSMFSRFSRRIGVTVKKTLVAPEQDRPGISRHRERWRTYQGLIDPRRLG
jgi:hypothetical protein